MMARGPLVLMSDKPRAWRKGVMQATEEALAGEACPRLVRRAAGPGRPEADGRLGGHVLPRNRCQRRRLLSRGGAGTTGIADRERRCRSGTRPEDKQRVTVLSGVGAGFRHHSLLSGSLRHPGLLLGNWFSPRPGVFISWGVSRQR